MPATTSAPWGHLMPAMVTPFTAEGEVDLAGAARLADHLIGSGHDGLVLAGTTGEAPTLTDTEHAALVRVVSETVGDRASVIAGVGTNDTAHTMHLARAAADAGATGLLVVTPYYSKPPQPGILAHFVAVANVTDLPVMLYDIPGRTGVEIAADTLRRLAEHPRIVAVKDATGDLFRGATLMADTDLAFYSGDDTLNLPWLALGAVGVVSVVSHLAGTMFADLVGSALRGDIGAARTVNSELLPLVDVVMTRTQGAIMVKAALALQGLIATATVRPPLAEAPADLVDDLRRELKALNLLDTIGMHAW